jgi:hypothetical protein
VNRNSDRGSLKFGPGSGNSGNFGGAWYPGDEWKGDIARMMMYMYLHYGNQCLPRNVGVGNLVSTDNNMVDLFLQWNAEDPVSEFEDKRNTYLGNTDNFFAQGNRNPFIDNPYLATLIWGGTPAENRWPGLSTTSNFDLFSSVTVYLINSKAEPNIGLVFVSRKCPFKQRHSLLTELAANLSATDSLHNSAVAIQSPLLVHLQSISHAAHQPTAPPMLLHHPAATPHPFSCSPR